jgi:predicted nucleotidyltransferase
MEQPLNNNLEIAKEVKKRLSNEITILEFRLFGSRAKDTADWDSDMDLYIEADTLDKSKYYLIHDIAWEVGFENDIVISPIVITKDQLESTPFRATPIYQIIQKEGIVL